MNNETVQTSLKTIVRASTILDIIQEREGARVSEVAAELDCPRSTAYRYLTTLNQLGYLVQEGDEYRIGLRFLDRGIHGRNQIDGFFIIKESIDKLVRDTGERVQFIREEHGKGFHIYNNVGEHSVQTKTRVGKQIYLHSAAAGKAILAELPEERVSEIIHEHGLPKQTECTITDEDELFNELSEVRNKGYALSNQERIDGLRSVGVPVIGTHNQLLGAVSISGATNRLSNERFRSELPNRLLGVTDEISLKLEYERSD
jgi:DNA-binding IclR family transcriptional regulator